MDENRYNGGHLPNMRDLFKTSPPSPFIIILSYLGLNGATVVIAAFVLAFFPELSPFLLFLPTILFITLYAGFMPGYITIALSLLSITGLLYYPINNPLLTFSTNLAVESGIFVIVALYSSYLLDKTKRQDIITKYQKKLHQNKYLIETLEKNYENAQKEIKSRDQFLAIASHELKTPVTSMLLQVQSAIHNIRNVSLANFSVANLLKMLEGTEQQSTRLSKMVNDLLNLSLITTGRLELELEEIDVSQTVRDVTDNFTEKLQKENMTITIDAQKPVIGMYDKVRIAQAITNLISNAIKYGNGQPISIKVENAHNHARLYFKDGGIGISKDQQKRIFERFERAVTSREYQGLGVGLYITNQIVKAHNGKITVDSQTNKGTSFIIELPLKQKD